MIRAASKTRASLILRIRDPRDAEAWSTFVDLYGPFIYQICQRSGLCDHESADTTQNVFMRLLGKIRTFEYRPEVGKFRGWLGRLTRNEIAETWERRLRSQRAHDHANTTGPQPLSWEDGVWEEAFATYILRLALERVRRRVNKRTWIVFRLTWIVGCPPERVALRLKMPIERVFEAKCRALTRLRQEVNELAEDAAALVPIDPVGTSRERSQRCLP